MIMVRNELVEDDIVSAIFTVTADVTSTFPATAIREIGFGAVPLLCRGGDRSGRLHAPVHQGAAPRAHHQVAERSHHVYLHGAQGLRDDLPD